MGQQIEPRHHRGAGGGEPRERLEHGIDDGQVRVFGEQEGQRAEGPQHGPEQHRDQEAIAIAQLLAGVPIGVEERETGQQGDAHRHGEGAQGVVLEDPRDQHRRHQRQAEQHQQDTEDARDHA